MKIRKAIKFAATGALAAAPLAAFAGAPAAFDNYSVNSTTGAITSSVSGCASLGVDEAGFMQEQCVIGGKTYIHTVLYDDTGAEIFSDENFVEMGGTGGIADKQSLTEFAGSQTFTNTSQLNTGSFFTAGTEARISLDQAVTDTGTQHFTTDFAFREGQGGAGSSGIGVGPMSSDAVVTSMKINTLVDEATFTGGFSFENRNVEFDTASNTNAGLADANALNGTRLDQLAVLNDAAASITQNFSLQERHGSFTKMDGTATGSITWAAGDSIINTKIGQQVGGAGVFGLHDFANETNGLGTGVDSFTSAQPGTFFQPQYTDGTDPFAAFQAFTDPTATGTGTF